MNHFAGNSGLLYDFFKKMLDKVRPQLRKYRPPDKVRPFRKKKLKRIYQEIEKNLGILFLIFYYKKIISK